MAESPTTPEPTPHRIIHWAHQGGAKEGPSNTMLAFRRATSRRDPNLGFELDVHRSADGVLVVIHDRTLERTTDGHGRVKRHTSQNLARLDAARWWRVGEVDDHATSATHPLRCQPPRPGCGIPTLDNVLTYWRSVDPRPHVTIEIKAWGAVKPLIAALADCTDAERELITLTSFFDWILWRVRLRLWRDHPSWSVGLAPGVCYMIAFWVMTALGVPIKSSRYTRLQIPIRLGLTFATPRLVRSARRVRVRRRSRTAKDQCLCVDVWTVDDEDEMRALPRLEVDGIMSDRPALLKATAEESEGLN